MSKDTPLPIDQMRTFLESVATKNNLSPFKVDTWHCISDLDLYQSKVVLFLFGLI